MAPIDDRKRFFQGVFIRIGRWVAPIGDSTVKIRDWWVARIGVGGWFFQGGGCLGGRRSLGALLVWIVGQAFGYQNMKHSEFEREDGRNVMEAGAG